MGIESIEHKGLRYAEIIRADVNVKKTTFYSPAESSFQFGLLAHDAGFFEQPHYHRPFKREVSDLQQMFVVQKGVVAVQLYDEDKVFFHEVILKQGDAIVLIHGIHSLRVIEDMQCISVKQGPFMGTDYDKVNVEVKKWKIPVFEPVIGEEEIQSVVAALRRGEISGTFGEALTAFEDQFASYSGCQYGVAVTSGTTALQIAVTVAGIKAGDEVLLSASTNIATALAIVHNGAVPVPVDSEDHTWNLNLDLIEGLITPRTKAIIPVHLFGHPVDMDRLMAIAKKHNLIVIEDAAEAHGATVRGRRAGSFGHMSCFSFYANKIITTGEGGMVTTNDKKFAERLRLFRNLGFTTPRFRHEVAAYNFRMTGYQAAMGLAQLGKIETIIEGKRRMAHLYNRYLGKFPGLRLPAEEQWARNVYWMYALVVTPEFGLSRDQLTKALAENGIETRTFFCPMNQQPCLKEQEGFRSIPCPVADLLWTSGFYLPSTHTLSEEKIRFIAETIEKIHKAP